MLLNRLDPYLKNNYRKNKGVRFNIIYTQDPDYMHPMLQPCLRQDSALAMFKCIACRKWTKYYWDKRHDLDNANDTALILLG